MAKQLSDNTSTPPTPVVSDDELDMEYELMKLRSEDGMYVLTSLTTPATLSTLIAFITSYASKYEIDIRIDEAKDIRKNIESLGTEVYFAVQRIDGHIDALKKQKEQL